MCYIYKCLLQTLHCSVFMSVEISTSCDHDIVRTCMLVRSPVILVHISYRMVYSGLPDRGGTTRGLKDYKKLTNDPGTRNDSKGGGEMQEAARNAGAPWEGLSHPLDCTCYPRSFRLHKHTLSLQQSGNVSCADDQYPRGISEGTYLSDNSIMLKPMAASPVGRSRSLEGFYPLPPLDSQDNM